MMQIIQIPAAHHPDAPFFLFIYLRF